LNLLKIYSIFPHKKIFKLIFNLKNSTFLTNNIITVKAAKVLTTTAPPTEPTGLRDYVTTLGQATIHQCTIRWKPVMTGLWMNHN
jgi:hypothetical protein